MEEVIITSPSFTQFRSPSIKKTDTAANTNIMGGTPKMCVWLYADDEATGSKCGIWECTAQMLSANAGRSLDGFANPGAESIDRNFEAPADN